MPTLVYIQNMLNPGISPLYTCVLLSSLCLPRRGDYWEFLARGMTSVHSKHQTRCLSCCMLVCPNLVLKKCLSFEELVSGVKILWGTQCCKVWHKACSSKTGDGSGDDQRSEGFQETKPCRNIADTDGHSNKPKDNDKKLVCENDAPKKSMVFNFTSWLTARTPHPQFYYPPTHRHSAYVQRKSITAPSHQHLQQTYTHQKTAQHLNSKSIYTNQHRSFFYEG